MVTLADGFREGTYRWQIGARAIQTITVGRASIRQVLTDRATNTKAAQDAGLGFWFRLITRGNR